MKRLREDIYRCRFLLPCALAAMLILRWAVLRGRPERMVELPLGPMVQWIGIAEGKAITFGVGSNNSDLEVHSKALEGGAARLVVRHPSEQSDVGAFVAGGYVYYTNVWYQSGNAEVGKSRNPWSSLGLEINPGIPFPAAPRKPGEPVRPAVLGLLSYGARGRNRRPAPHHASPHSDSWRRSGRSEPRPRTEDPGVLQLERDWR